MTILEQLENDLCRAAVVYAQSGTTSRSWQEAIDEMRRARVNLKLAAIAFAREFKNGDLNEHRTT